MDISLSAVGFRLTLPSGRTIDVANSPHAAAFIHKLLWDAEHMQPGNEPPGYIGRYPTQAIADKWVTKAADIEAFKEAQRIQRAEQLEAELGVSLSSLNINI